MATISVKTHVGKEDINIQQNTSKAETFSRKTSSGGTRTITKMPDVWDGLGRVNAGKVTIRALDDNDTILHSFGGTT